MSHGYPVQAILPEQVQRFTREALRARSVRRFSARRAVEVLQASEGRKFLALDIGGDKISASYFRAYDRLALALYDNSIQVTAHAILGMASAFGLLSRPEQLTIVGHGGIFNVSGYGERLCAILRQGLGHEPQVLLTKDFSANACLEGAAIAVAS
jgi:hypothetical protein